jgi:hypothetical protein
MCEWSEAEVGGWLQSIGAPYAQYCKSFADNCLNGRAVLELTQEELKELGVVSGVHRARLMADIKLYASTRSSPAPATSVLALPRTTPTGVW